VSAPRERQCTSCGRTFRGSNLRCQACSAIDRACVGCGKTFRGTKRQCRACQAREHSCTLCGSTFHGTQSRCNRCRRIQRECTSCGRTFRGTNLKCPLCGPSPHECTGCGRTFRGTVDLCTSCRRAERECAGCGQVFYGSNRDCPSCARTRRPVADLAAYDRRRRNARRARKLAAQISGPLPLSIYAEIIASGPCVYCGGSATTVDHIRPLARGGHEAAANLAPACTRCNASKGARLLTEWRPDRVAQAIAASPLVAAEYRRQARGEEYAEVTS
jgi:5-methylcytosine-specific restriction endonuclease McrA